jgi:hypothetical protein
LLDLCNMSIGLDLYLIEETYYFQLESCDLVIDVIQTVQQVNDLPRFGLCKVIVAFEYL